MGKVVFVEVLGRGDRVTTRQRIKHFPFTIGRGYDNDVILDDPFVQKHAATVALDSEGIVSVTHSSTGTTYAVSPTMGLELTIGRASLRLRTPEFVHGTTRIEPFRGTRLSQVTGSHSAHIAILLFSVGTLSADRVFSGFGVNQLAGLGDLPAIFLAALVWAFVGSIAGKVRSIRGTILSHFTWTLGAFALAVGGSNLAGYCYSLAPQTVPLGAIKASLAFIVLSSLFGLQLLAIGAPTRTRAILPATSIAVVMVGVALVLSALERENYNGEFKVDAIIRPIPNRLLVVESPKEFAIHGERLRSELADEIRRMTPPQ